MITLLRNSLKKAVDFTLVHRNNAKLDKMYALFSINIHFSLVGYGKTIATHHKNLITLLAVASQGGEDRGFVPPQFDVRGCFVETDH